MTFKSKYDWTALIDAFVLLPHERQKELEQNIDEKTIEHICLKNEEYEKETPLHMAAKYGLYDVCVYYLSKRIKADVKNNDGWTPLHYAADSSADICRLLLQHGADPLAVTKSSGETPFHEAASNKETCPVFMELKLDPNIVSTVSIFKGSSPFLRAASFNDLETLEQFLKAGGDVHHFDGDGESALFKVAGFLDKKKFQLLIQYGADPRETGKQGKTLVHFMMTESFTAVSKELEQKKHREQIEFLAWLIKEYGLSCDVPDKKGNTPLHIAAENGAIEYIPTLLKHGADLNARNTKKETALHCAFEIYNSARLRKTIEYLLKIGVDPRTKDAKGKTALDLAQSVKDSKLIALLEEALRQWEGKSETTATAKKVEKKSEEKNSVSTKSDNKKKAAKPVLTVKQEITLPEIVNLNHYPEKIKKKNLELLHQKLGTTLPDYDEFVSKYGNGIASYVLRVYMPDRILDENDREFRTRWDEYYLWDDDSKLEAEDLAVSTILADTVEGDEFVWFPGRDGVKTKPGIYLLPRNDSTIVYVGSDLGDVFRYLKKMFKELPKDFFWLEGFKNITLQKYIHPGKIPVTFKKLIQRIQAAGSFDKELVSKKTATFFSSDWGGLFDLDYDEKVVFIRCDRKTNLKLPHSLLIELGFIQTEKDIPLYVE